MNGTELEIKGLMIANKALEVQLKDLRKDKKELLSTAREAEKAYCNRIAKLVSVIEESGQEKKKLEGALWRSANEYVTNNMHVEPCRSCPNKREYQCFMTCKTRRDRREAKMAYDLEEGPTMKEDN